MTESRLESVTIRDFRSIRGTVYVPLNAPVVLIHGANGAGKSSIMTALEMALTGRSANLERADRSYFRHLVHDDRDSASIDLKADISGVVREVASNISGAESCEALLDAELGRHFTERNYLPQSALGRLLEIYQNPGVGTLSPLTRFVNELLGLDRYDALVEGLAQLQDVRNMRKLAPDYADAERVEGSALSRVTDLEASLRELQPRIDATRSQLAEELGSLGLELSGLDDSARDILSVALAGEEDERDLVVAQALRQEGQILEERLSAIHAIVEIANAEERAAVARAEVVRWLENEGARLERAIEQVRAHFPDVPSIRTTNPVDAHAAALDRAQAEVDRCGRILARDELARQRTTELDQALVGARSRLSRIDEQLAGLASDGGSDSLASLLSDVLAHIDGQVCPVCDRDFEEAASGPLDVHVSAKIARLSQRSQELERLAATRREASNDVAVQERLSLDQAKEFVTAKDRAQLRDRTAALTEAMNALIGMADVAARGQIALQEGADSLQASSKIRERSDDLRNADAAIRELSARVLHTRSDRGPVGAVLTELLAALDRRIEGASERVQSRRLALSILENLGALQGQVDRVSRDLAMAKREQAAAKAAITRSGVVRGSGRFVAQEAQSARTEIVRAVFNDSLNRTWRDLFVRLAPDETYVPAFRVPPTAGAAAVAQLETITRTGGRAGPPGTMLSAGNLNTAALTLFLSLHLTSPSRLPWLLLDDPVQSMDDVHTSQFAALLRTLSKQHQRQIVVAVHERALFEYLTLELSPAFPGDELLTVEVTRTQGQDTLVEPTYLRWEEDPAFPVMLAAG
jgi:exonuclease SbcC